MIIKRVISGGQIGADIAGLRAAHAYGIPTGGYMPRGFRTLNGYMSPEDVRKYGMTESVSPEYSKRTAFNVNIADITIRFATSFTSPGEKCTLKYLRAFKKPYIDVPLVTYKGEVHRSFILPRDAAFFILKENFRVDEGPGIKYLNVAGNARKDLEPVVEKFLLEVFALLDK